MSAFSVVSVCDSSKTDPFHLHTHHHAEIIYVKEGKIRFRLSENEFEAAKGDLILVNRMEKHGTHVLEEPYHRLCVNVAYDAFADEDKEHRLFSVVQGTHGDPILHLGTPNAVEPLMAALIREINEKTELSEQMVASLTEQLLITLYRLRPDRHGSGENKRIYSKILAIQQYIDEHFAEDITVEQLAKENFISPDYLTKCFREVTGYSPKQYITTNRLVCARKLIRTTDMTVDSVAEHSGFFNVNNFIRSFKQYYGETPGSYYKRSRL